MARLDAASPLARRSTAMFKQGRSY